MPIPKPTFKISYKNGTDEEIPQHAVLQFTGDIDENDLGDLSVVVMKPDGSGDHFALDEGGGATNDDEGGRYAQCVKPFNGLFWAHYISEYAPGTAWEAEVGPVADQWYMDATGSGFVYAGKIDTEKKRILVMQMSGGGGSAAEGRLLTAITPATDSLDGATRFTFRRFKTDKTIDPQTDPVTLVEDSQDTDGINRSTKLSANEGGYVVCVKTNGEWRPVWCEDECAD